MKCRHAALCVLVATSLVAQASPHAQSPAADAGRQAPPAVTFQVEINYVDVDVVVTDSQGRTVAGLSRDDFELLEDGKPQKIEMFSSVVLPATPSDRFLGTRDSVPIDARSNRRPFDGRVYVVVLDDLDISPLRTGTVKQSARDFVSRYMSPDDIAAVVYTSGRTDATQDFTNDRALLLVAIDKFVGKRLRSAAVERLEAFYQKQLTQGVGEDNPLSSASTAAIVDSARPVGVLDSERAYRTTAVLETLKNLGEFLSGVRGRRKAVLLFSEGLELPISEIYDIHTNTEVVGAIKEAITAAAKSNVSYFAFDPRGLIGLSSEYVELAGSGAPDVASGAFGALNAQQGLLTDIRVSQDTLKVLSDESGGFAAVSTNDLTGAFERIVDANSRYYVLGYYPPDHPRDGRFHTLEVRVKRPGVRVTARKGYASPREPSAAKRRKEDEAKRKREAHWREASTLSPELRDALDAPLQQSGLSFTVQAAPFRDTTKDASIALAIEVDGDRVEFMPQDGTYGNRLELSFFAVTHDGKNQRVTRSEYNLQLKPETYARIKAAGLRINHRMSLPPGRYQVRLGSRESVGKRLGTVFYDLDVPDFRKEPLMMSGLLLLAPSSDRALVAQPDPSPAAKALPRPATSRRTFGPGDTIGVFTEIYDNLSEKQARQIDTAVTLTSESGQEVFAVRKPIANATNAASNRAPSRSTLALLEDVPLKGLSAGRYLLRVEARVQSTQQSGRRETLITIAP
jgi:VWFA-related protein